MRVSDRGMAYGVTYTDETNAKISSYRRKRPNHKLVARCEALGHGHIEQPAVGQLHAQKPIWSESQLYPVRVLTRMHAWEEM